MIKRQIDKLIDEYKSRIHDCDILINLNNDDIKSNRSSGLSEDWKSKTLAGLRQENAVHEAVRQRLVQSIVDVESLLDFI